MYFDNVYVYYGGVPIATVAEMESRHICVTAANSISTQN